MKITSIHIQDENSQLKDFRWTSDMPINILIGQNGSGKTTVLKYLVWIFMEARNKYVAFKNFSNPPFKFSIDYTIKLNEKISNFEGETEYVDVNINNLREDKDTWEFSVNGFSDIKTADRLSNTLFPENIIAYYAGWDDSISWLFEDIEERYKELARENPDSRLDFGYTQLGNLPLLYIKKIHFEILLACLFSFEFNYDLDDKLKEEFNITKQLGAVVNVFIKKPSKPFKAKSDYDSFWGASGELGAFLQNIRSRALEGGTYNEKEEYITFSFNLNQWYNLREFYGSEKRLYHLFHLLNASDLLSGFQIFFNKDGKTITNRSLSEGEQQLLTVIGIKELLLERNSLLLLDEPDTFLHPSWQEYFISNIIDNIYDLPIGETTNFEPNYFITTHSPNLLKNANNKFVKVHILNEGVVNKYVPNFYGRTISSINYELMGVKERASVIAKSLNKLFTHIELEELDKAIKLYDDLLIILGKDDKDLEQAKVELDFLNNLDE